MADTDNTTIVGQWLLVNGAGKYTKSFFDKGFKELRDLTGEAISAIVSDNPELARKLAESLEELADPGNDPAPPPWSGPSESGPAIPTLPPKTVLDLSQPTVKVPDIPEFKIPDVLRVKDGGLAITEPSELSQGDWLTIARNWRILHAYTMGAVSRKAAPPPRANIAALDWMVPDSNYFFEPMHLEASVETEVTYTEDTASYVRAGFDKQEASAGFPFAAASFEREHKERQAGASEKKQLVMIGRWYYPRVQLTLKECATASERFKTAVRNALDDYDRTNNIKPLLGVFRQFGTVIPNKVTLGGELLLVHTEDCVGKVSEREVENVISAAVSLKTTQGQGSAGASFQNAQGEKVTSTFVSERTTFTVRGGDATKASDPQSWPDSVKPPSRWNVIGRSELTSIVDWLPEDLRSRVKALEPKVPLPPAIWELQETLAQDHNGKAERAQFVLGARIVPDQRDRARGAVQVACGTSLTPQLGQGDAVGGRASFHRQHGDDIWIDTASICLPVPAGYHYAAATPDTWAENGKAPARFAIAETNLTLGNWRPVETSGHTNYRGFKADTDGFVFCSLEARNDGDRGYATCTIDNTIIAAASVHNYRYSNCWLQYASFCAPYAKDSVVEITITPTSGQLLYFYVWRIPSTSQAWKFTRPEALSLGSWVAADTDAFVNGVVTVPDDGPRGILRLECAEGRNAAYDYPIASAAVHVYHHKDRFISHSSAMIPVRKDYFVFADWRPTAGAPQVKAYLTKVVPVV